MNAVDTNVLIYAHDPRDPGKQQLAISLLNALADPVLLWQVACEFRSAGLKLAQYGFDDSRLVAEVDRLRSYWTSALPTWDAFDRSEDLRGRFSLSFWDSVLIAAALEANVETLYSEDFDSYSTIDGMNVVNPFRNSL